MQLVLTEDQELLAKTAADWVREHSPVARVRAAARRERPDRLLARRSGSRWPSSAGSASCSPRSTAAPAWASPISPSCSKRSAARSRPSRSSRPCCSAARRSRSAAATRRSRRGCRAICAGDTVLALRAAGAEEPLRPATASRRTCEAGRRRLPARRREDPGARRARRRRARSSSRARPARERDARRHHALPGSARRGRASRSRRRRASTTAAPRSCGSTACASAPTRSIGAVGQGAALLEQVVDRATVGLCAPRCSAR